jgi:hypothetical protein
MGLTPLVRTLKRTIRGCGDLPHCGSHPGTGFLFAFIILAAIAVSDKGWKASASGAVLMASFIAPVYLVGAHDRAVEEEFFEKPR